MSNVGIGNQSNIQEKKEINDNKNNLLQVVKQYKYILWYFSEGGYVSCNSHNLVHYFILISAPKLKSPLAISEHTSFQYIILHHNSNTSSHNRFWSDHSKRSILLTNFYRNRKWIYRVTLSYRKWHLSSPWKKEHANQKKTSLPENHWYTNGYGRECTWVYKKIKKYAKKKIENNDISFK